MYRLAGFLWRVRSFLGRDENGASSTDFVVLTAALVGVVLGIITMTQDASLVLTGRMNGWMDGVAP